MYRVDFYRKNSSDKDYHMNVFDENNECIFYQFLADFQSIDIDEYMKIYFKDCFEIYDLNIIRDLIIVRLEVLL